MARIGRVLPAVAPRQSYRHWLQRISLQSFAAPMTGDTMEADRWSLAVPKAVADPNDTFRFAASGRASDQGDNMDHSDPQRHHQVARVKNTVQQQCPDRKTPRASAHPEPSGCQQRN